MIKNKVLMITPIYYPNYGGAEKAVYELCKGLSEQFEVELLCPNFGAKKFEKKDGFKINRVCKAVKNKYYKFFKYQFFFFIKGFSLIKKNRYDIIHSHYTFPTGFASLLLSKIFKIPYVITEHHYGTGMDILFYNENPKFLNPFIKYILKKSDLVISTGATQNEFIDYIGNNQIKYKIVHLGGDCSVSKLSKDKIKKEFKIPKNKKIVFSISRLVKRKRYDLFIQSVRKISSKREDILFLIGGKGPEFKNLNNLIKKYNLENNVKLLGFVTDSNLEKYRKISDIFVSTSEFEGAGIIYFESFASKIPIFAKKNVASMEAIEDKRNGILFNNENELADYIDNYIDDIVFLKKLAKEAYKIYKKKYNWQKYTRDYKKIYFNLIIK